MRLEFMFLFDKTKSSIEYHDYSKLLVQPLFLCPSHTRISVVLLWILRMKVLLIILVLNIGQLVLPQISKCCEDGHVFYQDTMQCGAEQVG